MPVAVLAVLAALVAPAYAGRSVTLPPTGTEWDYQLGGSRPVPAHVGIVERDRHASPVGGKYNVCYVNGFQTQTEQKRFWRRHHWSLVLKDHGKPVVDSAWGEWLLDTRTAAERHALARIIGRWTDRCAKDGFDAVEYDAKAFRRGCRLWGDRIAVVRRDVDLTRHGVRRWC